MTTQVQAFTTGITGTGGFVGPLTQTQQVASNIGGALRTATKIGSTVSPIISATGKVIGAESGAAARESASDVLLDRARQEGIAGKFEVEGKRTAAERFRSKQAAAFGKAGLRLTGSAKRVIEATAEQQEKDILISQFETAQRQRQLELQAAQQRRAAEEERLAGRVGGFRSLLTGAFA